MKFIDSIGLNAVTMEAGEDTGEESDQRTQDLPKKKKKKKTAENDVKTKSLQSKHKKRNCSEVQEEGHRDSVNKKTPTVVGLSDVETALKSITVKVRNKLLFDVSVMEGGWFDQVHGNANILI